MYRCFRPRPSAAAVRGSRYERMKNEKVRIFSSPPRGRQVKSATLVDRLRTAVTMISATASLALTCDCAARPAAHGPSTRYRQRRGRRPRRRPSHPAVWQRSCRRSWRTPPSPTERSSDSYLMASPSAVMKLIAGDVHLLETNSRCSSPRTCTRPCRSPRQLVVSSSIFWQNWHHGVDDRDGLLARRLERGDVLRRRGSLTASTSPGSRSGLPAPATWMPHRSSRTSSRRPTSGRGAPWRSRATWSCRRPTRSRRRRCSPPPASSRAGPSTAPIVSLASPCDGSLRAHRVYGILFGDVVEGVLKGPVRDRVALEPPPMGAFSNWSIHARSKPCQRVRPLIMQSVLSVLRPR